MAEAGVTGVDQTSWLACSARPACREPIRERIARELVAIAQDPAYQTKFRNTGFEPVGLDAAATAAIVPRRGRALDARSSRSAG